MNKELQELDTPFHSENVTYCKVKLSTNILELLEVIPNDPSRFGKPLQRKGKEEIVNEVILEKRKENKKWMTENGRFLSSLTRSRTKVFEHVCNNFSRDSVFITLTYNTPVKKDDYDLALKHFDLFRRKMKDELGEFRYLAIAEIQPISQRIHFHMLVDRKHIKKKKLEEMWGQGFVKVKEVYGKPSSISYYITKYMTKETIIPFRKKTYLCSRNLKKSIVIKDLWGAYELTKSLLENFDYEESDPFAFETWLGKMRITKYYFPDIDLQNIDVSMYNNELTEKSCDILSTLENPRKVKTVKSNQLTIKSTT